MWKSGPAAVAQLHRDELQPLNQRKKWRTGQRPISRGSSVRSRETLRPQKGNQCDDCTEAPETSPDLGSGPRTEQNKQAKSCVSQTNTEITGACLDDAEDNSKTEKQFCMSSRLRGTSRSTRETASSSIGFGCSWSGGTVRAKRRNRGSKQIRTRRWNWRTP
jgi:hypothetical protein